jgi:hypothetical protein
LEEAFPLDLVNYLHYLHVNILYSLAFYNTAQAGASSLTQGGHLGGGLSAGSGNLFTLSPRKYSLFISFL